MDARAALTSAWVVDRAVSLLAIVLTGLGSFWLTPHISLTLTMEGMEANRLSFPRPGPSLVPTVSNLTDATANVEVIWAD